MCGIFGVIELTQGRQPEEGLLERMGQMMVHRGPNDHGHYSGKGAAIGMRRLSIIDLEGGHQPIGNEDGTVWVVCNGEIYNFKELRTELEARGHLVIGMPFHKYFFDLPATPQKPAKNVTMSQPHVRLMGDSAALLSYVRLTQSIDAAGEVHIGRVEETRVWQKIRGDWKHVHFHRSGNA